MSSTQEWAVAKWYNEGKVGVHIRSYFILGNYEKNWFIGRNPETGTTASPKYIHKLQ